MGNRITSVNRGRNAKIPFNDILIAFFLFHSPPLWCWFITRPARQSDSVKYFSESLTFNCFIFKKPFWFNWCVGAAWVCVFTECRYLQFVSISLIVPNYRPATVSTVSLQYNTKTSKELHSNHQPGSSHQTGNMISSLHTAPAVRLSQSCRSPRCPRWAPSWGWPGGRAPGGRLSSTARNISSPVSASSPRISRSSPTLCWVFTEQQEQNIYI